jgi:hypothetical protein
LNAASSAKASTTRASVSTLRIIVTPDDLPEITPVFYNNRRHSHAPITLAQKEFLGYQGSLAALKTRSHSVAIAGQDKWYKSVEMKRVIGAFAAFLNPPIPRTLIVVFFHHSSWSALNECARRSSSSLVALVP